jgi:hypothetical protein
MKEHQATMTDEIEVFRDMTLKGPSARRAELRDALLANLRAPWTFDAERSESARRNAVSEHDVLLFRHQEKDGLPAAGLTLWGTDDGYYVPNVVPLSHGWLSFKDYNAILALFVREVVEPVAASAGFAVELTAGEQGLNDWMPETVAQALRLFSSAANKSTGASHPLDQKRWFAFLLAAHRSDRRIDAEQLARWLHEVERWDEDSAHRLAGDYERALSLLAFAEEN